MGLVISGTGKYNDCSDSRIINVKPGDIIFVPVTSRYISEWSGNPEIKYISIHFSFEESGIFSRNRKYILQKITPDGYEELKSDFRWILDHYNKGETEQLIAMSKFYGILGKILPYLKSKTVQPIEPRMTDAIEYIEKNFEKEITVETLAKISNMSVSRFFPQFKKSLGVTPTEYINNYRINRAIIMLINDSNMSIEAISDASGFQSAAYFRRVFKKITGKTPREYKSMGVEI